MDKAASIDRQRAWDAYWKAGELHSCVGSYGGNYAGAMAGFWKERFARLQPGARVLDLATGNGALPLLLLRQVGAGAGLAVDAVDMAAIAPAWPDQDTASQVSFHPRIAMESLPFEDAVFDLVVSQFGLEYASWPEALGEALRVCKAGGSAAFVLHHAGSVLVQVGRHELANQQVLRAEHGLLAAARAVLPWVARARNGGAALTRDPDAVACRARYNEAMNALGDAIGASAVPDLLVQGRDLIHGLVGACARGGSDDASAALEQYEIALQAARLRTSEMIEHALDGTAIDAMRAAVLELRPGSRFSAEPIVQEQGILGWGVRVEPESAA